MTLIEVGEKKHIVPSKWNELSKEQLLFICDLQSKDLKVKSFEIQLIKYMLNYKSMKELEKIGALSIRAIAKKFLFLQKDSKLTQNKLPTIKLGRKTYKGPEQALSSLTSEQFFEHADNAYMRFVNKDEKDKFKYLNYLIACLYTEGDKFDASKIEDLEKKVERLATKYKYAILHYYSGSRSFVTQKFSYAFSGAPGKKPDGLEYMRLNESLNDGDLTKNKELRKVNLYELLLKLNKKPEKLKRK